MKFTREVQFQAVDIFLDGARRLFVSVFLTALRLWELCSEACVGRRTVFNVPAEGRPPQMMAPHLPQTIAFVRQGFYGSEKHARFYSAGVVQT